MPRNRPIIQTDPDGNLIKEFKSPEQAMHELKIKSGAIAKSLSGSKVAVLGKWKFYYKRGDTLPGPIPLEGATGAMIYPEAVEKGRAMSIDLASITIAQVSKIVEAEPVDPEDKWLTPYERIMKRRHK